MKVGLLKGDRCVAVIPVEVNENTTADILKTKAEEKHKLFHSPIHDECHVLLYKDRSVVDSLPGQSKPFTLGEYKKTTGWSFSDMKFYIRPLGKYYFFIFKDYFYFGIQGSFANVKSIPRIDILGLQGSSYCSPLSPI